MAKKTGDTTKVTIIIDANPAYCGIGAGGVQFAYGKAVIDDGCLADWYREHDGYTVKCADTTADNVPEAVKE